MIRIGGAVLAAFWLAVVAPAAAQEDPNSLRRDPRAKLTPSELEDLKQTQKLQPQIDRCVNKEGALPVDQQIAGCTAAITSNHWKDNRAAWAYANRGLAYSVKGDHARAMADLDKAIELDPNMARAFFTRGNVFSAKGDYDHAIADFDKAVSLNPLYADAYKGRGVAYEKAGNVDRSMADFDKAVELQPNNPVFLNSRCWARGVEGRDLQKALDDCNAALKIAPGSAYVLNSRGMVQIKAGKYEQAIEDLSTAIREDAKDADSLYARGVARVKVGDTRGGGIDMAAATAINPDIANIWARYGVK
jgi:tetratricopeptide (TPR) repeat protein